MPKKEIEAPSQEWLTEEEAFTYMRVTFRYFQHLVDTGYIIGVRDLNRQNRLFHWKGILQALWRLELGDLPQPEQIAKLGKTSRNLDELGQTS
jgi:hypothetical protein